MIRKLAGHTPLQDMIDQTINNSRTKIAASEKEEKERKASPFVKKDKKDEKDEKKDEKEKKSSAVIDVHSSDDLEKFASALEAVGDGFLKEAADSINNGGESKQGGGQLPTNGVVPGHQPAPRGSSKHPVPMHTGTEASSDGNSGNRTATPTDEKRAPGAGKAYPAKGVLKTASPQRQGVLGLVGKIQGDEPEGTDEIVEPTAQEKTSGAENPAVGFILNKIAESKQGGESPGEFKSGQGPKPASDSKGGNDARKGIESNQAVVNMTKAEAKAPQKRMLAEVLSEPALSKKHDPVVHDNLRNAAKGGVKIAAAQKAFLQKIASDPNDPRHEKLKEAVAKYKASRA